MIDNDTPPDQPKPTQTRRLRWALFIGIFCIAVTGLALVPGVLFAQTPVAPKINATSDAAKFYQLQSLYYNILQNWVDEADPDSLIDGAMAGMLASLKDPYSTYLDTAYMRDLTDTTSGNFGGIGAHIEKERNKDGSTKTDGAIVIASPIEGTPAYRAGLRPDDLIIKIDTDRTDGMTIDDAVKHLRGKPGSKVELQIRRGSGDPFNISLVREAIEVPTFKSAMIGDVAYMKLIQFTPKTADRVEEFLTSVKNKKLGGIIIDLRNNPGGLLEAPIDIADLFYDDGTIVATRGRMASENMTYTATPGKLVSDDVPLVILANGASASASEILSGALKDRGRALLVGEKTYGKGLVQRVIPLGSGDHGYKLTTARYYTPSGLCIDKLGIQPDYEVKEPVVSDAEGKAFQQIHEKGLIEEFVKKTPKATLDQIKAFADDLRAKSYPVSDRWVYRLVRMEINRISNTDQVYDQQYDDQLQKALSLVQTWDKVKKPITNPAFVPLPAPPLNAPSPKSSPSSKPSEK